MNTRIAISVNCLLTVAGALCGGCDRNRSGDKAAVPPVKAPATQSAMAARLEASLQISSVNSRDEALKQVAIDAARAGESIVVMDAVAAIAGSGVHDEAAREAALALRATQTSAAVEVAKTIRGVEIRDQTLQEIAGGQ